MAEAEASAAARDEWVEVDPADKDAASGASRPREAGVGGGERVGSGLGEGVRRGGDDESDKYGGREVGGAPLPDIYAVGLQEVDTSVGAAMFTAFETKRAREWEDVVVRRCVGGLELRVYG